MRSQATPPPQQTWEGRSQPRAPLEQIQSLLQLQADGQAGPLALRRQAEVSQGTFSPSRLAVREMVGQRANPP